MDERVMQFRVGVMILAALLVAVILALVFGGVPSPFRKAYTIQVKFSSAPGVSVGTPVRKSGIRIGEVSSVEFAADDQVLVTLRISANYRVRHDETSASAVACWATRGWSSNPRRPRRAPTPSQSPRSERQSSE